MKRQKTFADAGFEKFRKKTRREQFLDDMELVVPWQKAGNTAETTKLL